MKQLVCVLLLLSCPLAASAKECVILLHGLARTAKSMGVLAEALEAEGYAVANIGYPSREKPIEELADIAIPEGLKQCGEMEAGTVNFVTHSMGGILVRQYLSANQLAELNRVVMLAPPNSGSEVAELMKAVPGYKLFGGPAGGQLGTGADDIVSKLGPVDFPLGIIAGTRSVNPVFSYLLPDADDGTLTVESTRVSGMCGFLTIPATHVFIMRNRQAIDETIHFLAKGKFSDAEALSGDCVRRDQASAATPNSE